MRENVGRNDRIVRSILGAGLVAAGLWQLRERGWLGVLGLVTGAAVLESAITRVCPLSAALGIDTRSTLERTSDFRADIDEQSDRIAEQYAAPLDVAFPPMRQA